MINFDTINGAAATKPTIILIIPTYNDAANLKRALHSVAAQTSLPELVLVCDDCGTDRSDVVVNSFLNELNIEYLRAETNGGPGAARQMGVDYYGNLTANSTRNISNDWIVFMDSDDVICPHMFEDFKAYLSPEYDMIFSRILLNGKELKIEDSSNISEGAWLHGKAYRFEFLKKNNIVFPPFRVDEDVAFNMLCKCCGAHIGDLDRQYYYWHTNPNSITHTKGEQLNRIGSTGMLDIVCWLWDKSNHNPCLAANISGCYVFYQNALCYGYDVSKYHDKLVEMLNDEEVMDFILCPQQRKENCYGHYMIKNDNTISFYRQTYGSWLLQFIPVQHIAEFMKGHIEKVGDTNENSNS